MDGEYVQYCLVEMKKNIFFLKSYQRVGLYCIFNDQAYELWFKQIIFELDSIRLLFADVPLEEEKMLKIVSR